MFQIKLNEWLQGRGRASVQWYMHKPEIRRNRLDNLKMELGIRGQSVLLIFLCALFCVSGCGKVGKLYPQSSDDFPSQYPKEVKR